MRAVKAALAAALLLLGSFALAQPVVVPTGLAPAFVPAPNSPVRLGSGGGSATPIANFADILRDFNGGTDEALVTSHASGLDTIPASLYDDKFDAGQGLSGTTGARSDQVGESAPCPPTCDGAQDGFGGDIDFPVDAVDGDTVSLTVNVKYVAPFSFSSGGVGVKHIRFHRYTNLGASNGMIDFYVNDSGCPYLSSEVTLPDANRYVGTCPGSASADPDVWIKWRFVVVLDDVAVSGGGRGQFCLYKNDALVGCITDEPTLPSATDVVIRALWGTYWNGPGEQPIQNQVMRYDDITVTSYR